MNKILAIVIMALVTYLPRAIPVAFIKRKITNRFIRSFLHYIPYAVLACMTFPGIFYCCSNMYLALIGTTVALILSLCNQKLYVVALVSVLAIFGFSFLF